MLPCLLILYVGLTRGLNAFVVQPKGAIIARQQSALAGSTSGKGFGKQHGDANEPAPSPASPPPPAKTYGRDAGSSARPIRDLIDSEAAMQDFFNSREEWLPLFRHLTHGRPSCQAHDLLQSLATESSLPANIPSQLPWDDDENKKDEVDSESSSSAPFPWRRLPAIPTGDSERQVLSGFLDSMHQSLLDIPVTDTAHDDDNDVQFVEEGRRMLAISRFHVLSDVAGGSLDAYDDLFATCWSELAYLTSQAEPRTGSLILLPDYDLTDLRRFADLNLHRPLEWLGIDRDFEVASLQRQSPAIRLLYKLGEIPDAPPPAPSDD